MHPCSYRVSPNMGTALGAGRVLDMNACGASLLFQQACPKSSTQMPKLRYDISLRTHVRNIWGPESLKQRRCGLEPSCTAKFRNQTATVESARIGCKLHKHGLKIIPKHASRKLLEWKGSDQRRGREVVQVRRARVYFMLVQARIPNYDVYSAFLVRSPCLRRGPQRIQPGSPPAVLFKPRCLRPLQARKSEPAPEAPRSASLKF